VLVSTPPYHQRLASNHFGKLHNYSDNSTTIGTPNAIDEVDRDNVNPVDGTHCSHGHHRSDESIKPRQDVPTKKQSPLEHMVKEWQDR
jgi:hypothetical protein